MTQYLFDTDILSYLMKRRFSRLQARFGNTSLTDCSISAITAGEILFGLESLGRAHPARERAIAFLQTIRVLDWPAKAASIYAECRHNTRKQPIGDRDVMIAAHALALNATLVTNNTNHFARIGPSLQLENWLWE